MSLVFLPVIALALIGAAANSIDSQSSQPTSEQPSTDQTDTILSEYFDHLYDRRFDKALATAGQLNPDPENKKGVAVVAAMRATALIGLQRDREAGQLIAEADRLMPEDPFPTATILEGSLLADRFDFAADAFDRLIARFPDVAREQRLALVSYFLRNEPKGEERRNEDRRISLARIGYEGTRGDWLAAGAIAILLTRGDLAGVGDLLIHIDDPQTIENMLVQKRYSPLWPKVEERAGPHLSKVRASSVASAEQDYLTAPDDREKLQLYINALRQAGRLDEAIAVRSKLPPTREAMAKADEHTGWSVNEVALALHEAGRADEADELFARLNEAPMDKAAWRVSMIINRLELLVADGKFQKAATLLGATELSARNDGNDYARQLVRRLKYCTLSSLGRKDEATKVLAEVLAHADDAPQPTIEGLLCAGEVDKAEQLTIRMLNDPKMTLAKKLAFEENFVRALQPVSLTSDDPSVWTNKLAVMRDRPTIAAAYVRLGRDMPPEYLPPKKTK